MIFEHGANVVYVGIGGRNDKLVDIYFELEQVPNPDALQEALESLADVVEAMREPTFHEVFGRRVIVIGAGAQVSGVVQGAVNEADRHNIRGERISVDTIPLVGEKEIAEAVRAVARLPRAECLVLAGSLMGGEISRAVREIREAGILVVSLRMAGSVAKVADLVVTDPLQAGTMAVMLVASTAKLDIERIRGDSFEPEPRVASGCRCFPASRRGPGGVVGVWGRAGARAPEGRGGGRRRHRLHRQPGRGDRPQAAGRGAPMGPEFHLISREAGERDYGGGDTIVVDPIDGSHNAKMGIPYFSLTLAASRDRTYGGVYEACVRNLVSGDHFEARRGAGAHLNW